MGKKSKMATNRKKKKSNNRVVEFFSALWGFWPVWTVLLIVIAVVFSYQYFQQNSVENGDRLVASRSEKSINKRSARINTIKFNQINVSGYFNFVDIKKLKTQVVNSMRAGYLSSDLEQVRKNIEAFPWIKNVSIKRIPPQGIEIKISEHVPMMRWKKKGLISEQGILFFPEMNKKMIKEFKTLPLLKVKQKNIELALGFLEKLLPVIQQMNLSFHLLEQDVMGGWIVTFADGKQVVFGRKTVSDRLWLFAKIWPVAIHKGDVQMIDLRYANGAAVRFIKKES